jgi:hypothetical protein
MPFNATDFGGYQTDLSQHDLRIYTSRTNRSCAGAANANAERSGVGRVAYLAVRYISPSRSFKWDNSG